MFVYLTFSMTLEEVIAGCEDAWGFFSGVFRVVVPDNMSPVVASADAVDPRLTREWLEYAQARGFVTDPARVRHPRDKPRVEAGVHYVQGNFFAGETFLDLADARSKMAAWLGTANARVHGTTRQVPSVVFAAQEAPCLLPARRNGTGCREHPGGRPGRGGRRRSWPVRPGCSRVRHHDRGPAAGRRRRRPGRRRPVLTC